MSKWDKTVEYLTEEVSGFKVLDKEDYWHQRWLAKIVFFAPYAKMWTTLYPLVFKPKDSNSRYKVLQHEGVHELDAQTFFGLLPAWPVLKWLNVFLFSIAYAAPQIFTLLALVAIGGNLWWLLSLLCLLPLPSPGRMLAEMRAYRRTRELGRELETMVENFTKEKYYYMWPFKKHVTKLLAKDSPYKKEMDAAIE